MAQWSDSGEQLLAALAQLEPDPSDPHDTNAVKVLLDGIQVGCLPRSTAEGYQKLVVGSEGVFDPPITTAIIQIKRLVFEDDVQRAGADRARGGRGRGSAAQAAPRRARSECRR